MQPETGLQVPDGTWTKYLFCLFFPLEQDLRGYAPCRVIHSNLHLTSPRPQDIGPHDLDTNFQTAWAKRRKEKKSGQPSGLDGRPER